MLCWLYKIRHKVKKKKKKDTWRVWNGVKEKLLNLMNFQLTWILYKSETSLQTQV